MKVGQKTDVQHALRVGWLYPGYDEVIKDGLITWSDRIVSYIGPYLAEKVDYQSEIMHYPDSLALPAFINAHTHLPETLIRGLADDFPLETWLYDHVWQVEPHMTKDDANIGAQLGMAEMMSTGTIGFVDQFYYADEIAQAVDKIGMKAYLHPSIFDDNPETGTIEKAFELNKQIYDRWHGQDDRIQVGFGPHALYSIDEDTFMEIYYQAKMKDTWIHTHVLETATERSNAIETWGMSTVHKFEEMGVLDRILHAHGVHMDESDFQLISKYSTPILHNLGSNLKLGSGIANITAMLAHNIPVVLGTDGSASNNDLAVLEEIRLAALVHKGISQDATRIPSLTALKLATSNNSVIFKDQYSGLLKEGYWADITVFNLDTVRSRPIRDPISNLIYSISPTDCQLTVSNGVIIYKNGSFTTIDIEYVKDEAQKRSDRMLQDADYEISN